MNVKIFCIAVSLLNILVIMTKIYNVLVSLENEGIKPKPVLLEADKPLKAKTADWRIVHSIGWILGVTVIIIELIVIFDAIQCLLFPLKAYLQSCCILDLFCFASALPSYEIQMSLYMPWLNDSLRCSRPPFSPAWGPAIPPFTSPVMPPPFRSASNIPIMNPNAGPPMNASYLSSPPSGGFPLFCGEPNRFSQSAFMQQGANQYNCNLGYSPVQSQRPPSPIRPSSPFQPAVQQQVPSVIIEEQQ